MWSIIDHLVGFEFIDKNFSKFNQTQNKKANCHLPNVDSLNYFVEFAFFVAVKFPAAELAFLSSNKLLLICSVLFVSSEKRAAKRTKAVNELGFDCLHSWSSVCSLCVDSHSISHISWFVVC